MLDETIINFIIIFLALEVYEVQWQKASTMIGMLSRMYERYKQSIFLFLIMHPTFYFAIYFMLATEYNFYAVFLFSMKSLDIGMKILLIKQVFVDKQVSHELSLALLAPIHKTLPYLGIIFYPILIFLTLS